jgi:uncharacterized protein (DUF2236 family)
MAKFPGFLQRPLEAIAQAQFEVPPAMRVDFIAPTGAPALLAPKSLTWRVMKNPLALIAGGIAAVLLELAEPSVRTGVWEHTSFRRDPATRMRRTGYAAMVTIYAPAQAARAMIEAVNAAHARIKGATPSGLAYRADDAELLAWVHATAAFGFMAAYDQFVRRLSPSERDNFLAEGAPIAALYGAVGAPTSEAKLEALFAEMRPRLEASDIIFEFLDLLERAPFLPSRGLRKLMISAAIEILPEWARETLRLERHRRFAWGGASLVRAMGTNADKLVIKSAPPAQACARLGLAENYLYR